MATSSEGSSSRRRFKGTGGPHGYGKYVILVFIYTWFGIPLVFCNIVFKYEI